MRLLIIVVAVSHALAEQTARGSEQTPAQVVVEQEDGGIVVDEEDLGVVVEEDTGGAIPQPVEPSPQTVAPEAGDLPQYVPRPRPPFEGPPCFACKDRVEAEKKLRMMKGYRSPKKAFIFSLLVPGLGQIHNGNYIRAGAYMAAELALIATGAACFAQGKERIEQAHDYADEHFDADKFWQYYDDLGSYLKSYTSFDDFRIAHVRQAVVWDSADFALGAQARSENYYGDITRHPLVYGWDDAEPVFGDEGFVTESAAYRYSYQVYQEFWQGDTIWLLWQFDKTTGDTVAGPVWGFSDAQKRYDDMLSEGNARCRVGATILPFIAINHLVSGLDALITAIVHNQKLAGKHSFWHRVRPDQSLALTPHGLQTRVGVRVGL